VGILGVGVVELPQLRQVAAIDGSAVAVDEVPQLKLIEHFLEQGFSRWH
jgi:hypothetical protein